MWRWPLHWQILAAMAVGAVVGLVLNLTLSTRSSQVRLPTRQQLRVLDSTNRIEIELLGRDGQPIRMWLVDPSGQAPGSVQTLAQLREKEPEAYEWFQQYGRSTARWIGDGAGAIGGLFLRMLKMVAVPLIITSLMTGVLGLSNASRLGRMFGQTAGYYLSTSLLAILTGLLLVNLIQPGEQGGAMDAEPAVEKMGESLGSVLFDQLERIIPENPIGAAAEGNFLSIIAFTLAFGVFTILVGGRTLETLRDLFQAAFQVMMSMTLAIIHLAPIGVLCLMLSAVAAQGIGVFAALGWYMLTVICALGFHALVTLPLIVWLAARRNPLDFARAMSPALLTAFSSASSNATLPLTLTSASERAGIPNRIGSFVLPLGATINMDGTALYEVVAVLFIAQLEPGISLTLTDQIIVVITALLASIGAAGIPHAGLVMMVVILQAVGLPADRVGVILAVDRVLDMCRTAVNVWSDSCGTAVIARLDPGEETPSQTDENPTPPGPPAEAKPASPAAAPQAG